LKTLRPIRRFPAGQAASTTLLLLLCAGREAIGAERQQVTSRWHCSTTESFQVYSTDPKLAPRLADHCEARRTQLANRWLGDSTIDSWGKCRCIVVVHPSAKEYALAVGRGGEHTSGCSTARVNKGVVEYRRIDLRSDRGDPLTAALPHELTHVVLTERFLDRPIPRWADEGMAILADPLPKQQGHQRDAQLATASAARFTARELLHLADYPPPSRQTAFYGQSAALVKFFVSRGGHAKFLDFVERSMTEGSDKALHVVYQIANATELERLWVRHAADKLVAQD
jgi:hypothetical protein